MLVFYKPLSFLRTAKVSISFYQMNFSGEFFCFFLFYCHLFSRNADYLLSGFIFCFLSDSRQIRSGSVIFAGVIRFINRIV